jgi:site-specific recombinase XerD
VIKYAIAEDYLTKNPFLLYRPKTVKKELVYLSPEQLKTLEETTFKTKRLQYLKDLFVFCCYTGLGFKEMKELKHSDISLDAEGNKWLTIHRNKTERNYKVVILPKADEVLAKYSDPDNPRVFPSISNANFNAYLKEIAAIIGVEFNLTHHVARKTFATAVLLYNGVSMDVVSKLLGHRKLQTTQEHYGEILTRRILAEIEKLN